MPATYEPIATTTLGSAAATITFNSIPATYTDIRVVLSLIGTIAGRQSLVTFNNDSSALYSMTYLYGTGTGAASGRSSNRNDFWIEVGGASTTIPHLITYDVFSYAGSTFKTVLATGQEDNNGSGYVSRTVALYRSTTAISRMDMTLSGTTFAIGTTATLYGIKNA